jgi:hypothetical protein
VWMFLQLILLNEFLFRESLQRMRVHKVEFTHHVLP